MKIFKILARINKMLLPSMIYKDFNKINIFEKMIIAYRYWVTKNSL